MADTSPEISNKNQPPTRIHRLTTLDAYLEAQLLDANVASLPGSEVVK